MELTSCHNCESPVGPFNREYFLELRRTLVTCKDIKKDDYSRTTACNKRREKLDRARYPHLFEGGITKEGDYPDYTV